MGRCCFNRGLNTPQAWQLGFLTVQQLDDSMLAPGQTVTVQLASQATAARSGLRIVPSWAPDQLPMYAGYRTAVGVDAALPDGTKGLVHIHTAASKHARDAQDTTWQAKLALGESWSFAATGITLRFTGMMKAGGGTAVLTVCRKDGEETAVSCAAGRDNDCNGLAGASDPKCLQFLTALRAPPRIRGPPATSIRAGPPAAPIRRPTGR